MGERRELPKHNKDQGLGDFCDLTTRGSSVVKSTCILRVSTSASVSIKHKEQDTQDALALRTGNSHA